MVYFDHHSFYPTDYLQALNHMLISIWSYFYHKKSLLLVVVALFCLLAVLPICFLSSVILHTSSARTSRSLAWDRTSLLVLPTSPSLHFKESLISQWSIFFPYHYVDPRYLLSIAFLLKQFFSYLKSCSTNFDNSNETSSLPLLLRCWPCLVKFSVCNFTSRNFIF
jgi:hypothetical protein